MSCLGSTFLITFILVGSFDLVGSKSVERDNEEGERRMAANKCSASKADFVINNSFDENLNVLKSAVLYAKSKYSITKTSYAFRKLQEIFGTELYFRGIDEFQMNVKESNRNPSEVEESLRLSLEFLNFLLANTDHHDNEVKRIPGLIDYLITDRSFKERPTCAQILNSLIDFVTSEGGLPRRLEAEYSSYFSLMINFIDNIQYYQKINSAPDEPHQVIPSLRALPKTFRKANVVIRKLKRPPLDNNLIKALGPLFNIVILGYKV